MHDDDLTSLVEVQPPKTQTKRKVKRMKVKEESEEFCTEPCGSPFCELCGVEFESDASA